MTKELIRKYGNHLVEFMYEHFPAYKMFSVQLDVDKKSFIIFSEN